MTYAFRFGYFTLRFPVYLVEYAAQAGLTDEVVNSVFERDQEIKNQIFSLHPEYLVADLLKYYPRSELQNHEQNRILIFTVAVKKMRSQLDYKHIANAPAFMYMIDYVDLREQKATLLASLELDIPSDTASAIEGMIHLLDALQDYAVDKIQIPRHIVFPPTVTE